MTLLSPKKRNNRMSRFCVAILILCAASLLALQVFVSLQPADVQASSHSGCADGTTEQVVGTLPGGKQVHGCNGIVSFANADSLCAAGWDVGDIIADAGLRGVLETTAGHTERWIRMGGDPGGFWQWQWGGIVSLFCFGTQSPCPGGAGFFPTGSPAHEAAFGLPKEIWLNGTKKLSDYGGGSLSSLGAICVGTPVNQPPAVSAGPDQTITLPAAAALDGTVSDDGLPNPPALVTTTWSKVSGPGTVTFANANEVDTTASFSVSGSYVLRLTATDSALSASDDLAVTVNPAPPPPPPPTVTITSPAAGSWHNASFSVGYDALNATNCQLLTSNDGGMNWIHQGAISCGANQTTSILVPAWCSTEGTNQCGVRIEAVSSAFASGCADNSTEQDFGTTSAGKKVHGCHASAPYNNLKIACAPGWNPGDLVQHAGLGTLLSSFVGTPTNYAVYLNGPSGSEIGWGGDRMGVHSMCWGTSFHAECTILQRVPNGSRPYFSAGAGSLGKIYFNGTLVLSKGGSDGGLPIDPFPANNAICVEDVASPPVAATDERFFSIDTTKPIASFDIPPTPADGTDQASDFAAQYDSTDNIQLANCAFSSSSDGGGTWTDRKSGVSACGIDQTDTVKIPGWCIPGARCALFLLAFELCPAEVRSH